MANSCLQGLMYMLEFYNYSLLFGKKKMSRGYTSKTKAHVQVSRLQCTFPFPPTPATAVIRALL